MVVGKTSKSHGIIEKSGNGHLSVLVLENYVGEPLVLG